MKAVTLGSNGVEIRELAEPKPSQNQVLVKVKSLLRLGSIFQGRFLNTGWATAG